VECCSRVGSWVCRGGGVRRVYILLMASWHGLPIGASGVMKTTKGKKRGCDSQSYEAQGGRLHGPRPPMQEYDQAQPRPSTKPHLIGRGGEACARWRPGRENHAVLQMRPGPQRELQSENGFMTEEHGGSDEHLNRGRRMPWLGMQGFWAGRAVAGRSDDACRHDIARPPRAHWHSAPDWEYDGHGGGEDTDVSWPLRDSTTVSLHICGLHRIRLRILIDLHFLERVSCTYRLTYIFQMLAANVKGSGCRPLMLNH